MSRVNWIIGKPVGIPRAGEFFVVAEKPQRVGVRLQTHPIYRWRNGSSSQYKMLVGMLNTDGATFSLTVYFNY